MRQLLIIGGSDAGISAALRARELSPDCALSLIVADRFPNFSICGIAYFLGGEVASADDLAHRKAADIEAAGIGLKLEHRATTRDPAARTVRVRTPEGNVETLGYDKLVLGIGAVSIRPPFPGIDLPGVFTLRRMGETLAIDRFTTHPASDSLYGCNCTELLAISRLKPLHSAMSRHGLR